MSCNYFGINVSDKIKSAIEKVSGGDVFLQTEMFSYLETAGFEEYLRANLSEDQYKIDKDGYIDYNSIHMNTFKSKLKAYHTIHYSSVAQTSAVSNAISRGRFSSTRALSEAKLAVANFIVDRYYENLTKGSYERKTSKEIILDTVEAFKKAADKTFDSLYAEVKERVDKGDKIRDTKLKNSYNTVTKELEEFQSLVNDHKEKVAKVKSLEIEGKTKEQEYIDAKNEVLESVEAGKLKRANLNAAKYNFVYNHGSVKQQNIVALYETIIADKENFLRSVFYTPRVSSISGIFKGVFETKVSEDNYYDVYNEEAESEVDQSTKSWNEALDSKFTDSIPNSIKGLFETLYHLNSPVLDSDGRHNYVKGPDIGARKPMGYGFVTASIISRGDFSSVTNLIKSIDDMSTSHPSLYGLVKLSHIMKSNPLIANAIFHNLGKPTIKKFIIDIESNGDISSSISNRESEIGSALIYRIINNIRSTIRANYSIYDIDIIKAFQNYYIDNESKNVSNETMKLKFKTVINIISKYIPTLDIDTLNNFIGINEDSINKENAKAFYDFSVNIINEIERYNTKYNDYIIKRNKEKSDTPFNLSEAFDGRDPYYGFYPYILSFSAAIKNYANIKVELNSTNSEGNMSSDTVNDAYIIEFIKLIKRVQNGDKIGYQAIIKFISDNKQFSNSPFLFGVKDKDGNVIKKGLFTKTPLGITVNDEAVSILESYLFDGTRDKINGESAMYEDMSPGDYFISQLSTFYKGPKEYINEDIKSAVYFVKTPSDAPRQFAVRLPVYSSDNLIVTDRSKVINYANSYIDSSIKINNKHKNNNWNAVINKIKDAKIITQELFFSLITPGFEVKLTDDIKKYIVNINGSNYIYADVNGSKYLMKIKVNNSDKTISASLLQENKGDSRAFDGILEDSVIYTYFDKFIIPDISNIELAKSSEVFIAIKQNVESELSNMLSELSRIGTITPEGKLIISNDDVNKVNGLFNIYHTIKGKLIDKNKLVGKVFNFDKLFSVGSYSPHKMFDSIFEPKIENGNIIIDLDKDYFEIKTNLDQHEVVYNPENDIQGFINNIIEDNVYNFIEEFIKDIITFSDNYSDINNDNFTYKYIINFMLNQYISNITLDEIFDGDSKFYKDAKTVLKRAKQLQAGGRPHAGANADDVLSAPITYTRDSNGNKTEIKINGEAIPVYQYIDGIIKKDDKGNPIKTNMVQRNGFRAVTINSVNVPLENKSKIFESLKQIYIGNGISEDIASKTASQIIEGYSGNITANDAQSYITLEEFIRRKYADGTLNEYGNISRFLDKDYIITQEDIKEITAIQVQKNFYYDTYKDPRTGLIVPRQIKNSEFVLIPALLNSENYGREYMKELLRLYELMSRYDIGQVNTGETSKAANSEFASFWEEETGTMIDNLFEEQIKQDDKYVSDYYYKHLYKQQDVKDHIKDEKNKASISFMKKFLDNPNPKIRSVIERYIDSYIANIEESYSNLIDELGWKTNSDGVIINKDNNEELDYSVFYEKARTEAARMGLNSQFIEFLTPVEVEINGVKFFRPNMPNYLSDNTSKLESIAQSIFNKSITRQTLPGWHGPQVSSVGINSPVLDDKGNQRRLKYHPEVSIIDVDPVQLANNKIFIEWALNNGLSLPPTGLSEEQIEQKIVLFATDLSVKEAFNKYNESLGKNKQVFTEPYMEIMVPKWSNIIPGDYDIKDLESQGIDIQIAYRVPTEGKQSITKVKVVGFLHEMYGSTVIVPDGWVAQSGSDFDVDSIYAVVYEMFKDKDGIIKKYEPIGSEEIFNQYNSNKNPSPELTKLYNDELFSRYEKYVKSRIKSKIHKDKIYDAISYDINETIEKEIILDDRVLSNKKLFEELNDIQINTFNILPKVIKEAIKSIDKAIKEEISKTPISERKALIYEYSKLRANTMKHVLREEELDKINLSNEDKENVYKYLETVEAIASSLEDFRNSKKETFNRIKNEIIQSTIDKIDEDYRKKVHEAAKEYGLIDIEEFSKLSFIRQQPVKVRNNIILDSMIKIISHPTSREENLSRSNFDDIKSAMTNVDNIRGATSKSYSSHNPIDQIEFMGNARSGATNKAFSVTLDTFKSICNFCRVKVDKNRAVTVAYRKDQGYDIESICKSYGIPYTGQSRIVVTHDMYGWSLDGKNAAGSLLTTYSSQTTAHALDVIKEGSIFNVNEYTFGMFKTLTNVGIDYYTSISFMAMPHMTEIVNTYNKSNSIYSRGSSLYFDYAIKSIVSNNKIEKIKGTNSYLETAIKILISSDNKLIKGLVKGIELNNIKNNGIININKLVISRGFAESRIRWEATLNSNDDNAISSLYSEFGIPQNNTSERLIRAYFGAIDIIMIEYSRWLHKTAQNIENLARVSNPDRFGAAPSIYETINKYNDAKKLSSIVEDDNEFTLYVEDKGTSKKISIVAALYKGIEEDKIDTDNSEYRYLSAFMNTAVKGSIEINQRLFKFDKYVRDNLYNILKEQYGINLTNEQFKRFKEFIIEYVYKDTPILINPFRISDDGTFYHEKDIYGADERLVEELRIKGYSVSTNANYDKNHVKAIRFTIENRKSSEEDINKAKEQLKDIMDNWYALTPAQKVIWLQSNLDDAGIFGHIKVRSDNNKMLREKGYSGQVISINDTLEDEETLFNLFREAFFNKDPMIRSAALDIVKYHFIANKGSFKKGGIGKIITNDALLDGEFSTNLVSYLDSRVYNLTYEESNIPFNFIRRNSEIVRTIYLDRRSSIMDKRDYKVKGVKGLKIIPINDFDDNYSDILNIEFINKDKDDIRIVNISHYVNKIEIHNGEEVPVGKEKVNELYVIRYIANKKSVIMYPINKLSEDDTNGNSMHNSYNTYLPNEFYEWYIKIYENSEYVSNDEIENKSKESKIQKVNFVNNSTSKDNINYFNDRLNSGDNVTRSVYDGILRQIVLGLEKNHNNKEGKPVSYFYTANTIFRKSFNGKTLQNIVIDGETKQVIIKPIVISRNYLKKLDIENESELSTKFRGQGIQSSIIPALSTAIAQGYNFSKDLTLYKVEVQNDTDIKYSIISGNPYNSSQSDNIVNVIVPKMIYNAMRNNSQEELDDAVKQGLNILRRKEIDTFSTIDIEDNRLDIYRIATEYYTREAEKVKALFENYITTTGETYTLTDPNLYKFMINSDKDANNVLHIINSIMNFAKEVEDLMNVSSSEIPSDIYSFVESIKKIVEDVRNNSRVITARNLAFNIYFASFSGNPLVQKGIIDVTTIFGDSQYVDSWLTDIINLDHKQIQLVTKQVYAKLDKARKTDAPKKVKSFQEEFERIESLDGEIDWSKIDDNGKISIAQTEEYVKDRTKLINDLEDVKNVYGESSIEYLRAKLALDEFNYNNSHQFIVREYYGKKNDIERRLINSIPILYEEYIKTLNDIKKLKENVPINTIEDRVKLAEAKVKLQRLRKGIEPNGEFSTDPTFIRESKILNDLLKEKEELNKEYFDVVAKDEFNKEFKIRKNRKEAIEQKNPDKSIIELLEENPVYAEDYNWLLVNTIETLDEESKEKISENRRILYGFDKEFDDVTRQIFIDDKAIDENGNIDPTKLSSNAVKIIRDKENEFVRIIRPKSPVEGRIWLDAFYDKDSSIDNKTDEEIDTINIINYYIRHGFTSDGHISWELLRTKLTDYELEELAKAFDKLRSIADIKKNNRGTVIDSSKFKTQRKFNKGAFLKTAKTAKNISTTSKDFELYCRIIGNGVPKLNSKGKVEESDFTNNMKIVRSSVKGIGGYKATVAGYNEFLFNYSIPKYDDVYEEAVKKLKTKSTINGKFVKSPDYYRTLEDLHYQFIDRITDKDKTKAKKWLEDNTRRQPKAIYRLEVSKRKADGTYDKWYKDNHYFDYKQRKMVPIKIWMETKAISGKDIKAKYEYNPIFEMSDRVPKTDAINKEYEPNRSKYNPLTGSYTRKDLNPKEMAMAKFLMEVLIEYSVNNRVKSRANYGFIPRLIKRNPTSGDYIKGLLSIAGVSANSKYYSYSNKIGFANDREATFDMFEELRSASSLEEPKRPIRNNYINESDYLEDLELYKKELERVKEHNSRIDNEIRDKDYKKIFIEFIKRSVEYSAKADTKEAIYFLLEDIKRRQAYKTSFLGNLKIDKERSTDEHIIYQNEAQVNTSLVVENWARRLLFDEFVSTKHNNLRDIADKLQAFTSAKYMAFNWQGGIKNIMTGMSNTFAEAIAGQFFDKKEFFAAQARYTAVAPTYILHLANGDKATTLDEAFINRFYVVNVEGILEIPRGNDTIEAINKVRNATYGFQTTGEHFMQNTSMFAIMDSCRVYVGADGKYKVGTLNDIIFEKEIEVIENLIQNNPSIKLKYDKYISRIRNDARLQKKYESFEFNINSDFIRSLNIPEITKKFIEAKKELVESTKRDFNSYAKFRDQFELIDGEAVLKDDSLITDIQVSEFRSRVISMNKKIHGVYDKLGAAMIERTFYGSVLMQYHKHMYPGIMKRIRRKGFYNEHSGTYEIGSYISLYRFLSTPIRDLVNESIHTPEQIASVTLLQKCGAIIEGILGGYAINYQLLPEYEKSNIRRALSDVAAIIIPQALMLLMQIGFDDDEIKDSMLLSNLEYILDAELNEVYGQTILGIPFEFNTLYSQPMAIIGVGKDLMNLIDIMWNIYSNPDYKTVHTTGRYKGKNKAEVIIRRNIPGLRVIDKTINMQQNNNYYKIGAANPDRIDLKDNFIYDWLNDDKDKHRPRVPYAIKNENEDDNQ